MASPSPSTCPTSGRACRPSTWPRTRGAPGRRSHHPLDDPPRRRSCRHRHRIPWRLRPVQRTAWRDRRGFACRCRRHHVEGAGYRPRHWACGPHVGGRAAKYVSLSLNYGVVSHDFCSPGILPRLGRSLRGTFGEPRTPGDTIGVWLVDVEGSDCSSRPRHIGTPPPASRARSSTSSTRYGSSDPQWPWARAPVSRRAGTRTTRRWRASSRPEGREPRETAGGVHHHGQMPSPPGHPVPGTRERATPRCHRRGQGGGAGGSAGRALRPGRHMFTVTEQVRDQMTRSGTCRPPGSTFRARPCRERRPAGPSRPCRSPGTGRNRLRRSTAEHPPACPAPGPSWPRDHPPDAAPGACRPTRR